MRLTARCISPRCSPCRHRRYSPSSPRRGDTHAVQLTPYKRSAVWWVRRHPQGRGRPPQRPLLPGPAPSVTAVTHLPVLHRRQPPRRRHPHRADGQHHASGGGGETVEPSHLSEMLGRDTATADMRGPHLCVPSLVLTPYDTASTSVQSPHCAAGMVQS